MNYFQHLILHFALRENKNPDTFQISEVINETGEYVHNLDDYEIVQLANDAEVTNNLPANKARKRYNLYKKELPSRAKRFSKYLEAQGLASNLRSIQQWLTETAELSIEPRDTNNPPKRFRPKLRVIHFDAACLTYELATHKNNICAGFAGDAPLFQNHHTLPVFPILWSESNPNIYQNPYKLVIEQAGTVLSGSESSLIREIQVLENPPATVNPIDELRSWWETEFFESNNRSPEYQDLLEMAEDLRIHPDDVPQDILDQALKR